MTLPAVPGIGERLGRVEAEFQPNHGASLRDAVDRLQRTVEAHVAAPADQAHPSPIAAGQSTG